MKNMQNTQNIPFPKYVDKLKYNGKITVLNDNMLYLSLSFVKTCKLLMILHSINF